MDKVNTANFYIKSAIQMLSDLKGDFKINNNPENKNQIVYQSAYPDSCRWPISSVESLITVIQTAEKLNERLIEEIKLFSHSQTVSIAYVEKKENPQEDIDDCEKINSSNFTYKILKKRDENKISPFVESSKFSGRKVDYDYSFDGSGMTPQDIYSFDRRRSRSKRRVNSSYYLPKIDKEEDISDPDFSLGSSSKKLKKMRKKIRKNAYEKKRRRGKRGRYRKYTQELKARAIRLANELGDISKAAKKIGVPPKNLKRWIVSGPIRKKGGRKTQDPEMEKKLFFWITGYASQYGAIPSSKEIKKKALQYSKYQDTFKASKGWLEKFLSRHNLDKKNRHRLLDMNLDKNQSPAEKEKMNSEQIFCTKEIEEDAPEPHLDSALICKVNRIDSFSGGKFLDHNFLGD